MAKQSNNQRPSERRRILIHGIDQRERVQILLTEIDRRQQQDTRLFRKGGKAACVVSNNGQIELQHLSARDLRTYLGQEATFEKRKKVQDDFVTVPYDLTLELCESLLSHLKLSPRLPQLERILRSPVFDKEGQLCVRNGYHKGLGAWIQLDFELPATNPKPTQKQANRALEIIEEEFLGDFPFVDKASKAHAIALGLLPFVRPMIEGPTPLHLVTAPVPRTGKTKLIVSLALGITGALPAMCPPSSEAEEWRKQITSTLLRHPQLVLIDNLPTDKRTDNPYLASVLTLDRWEARTLGASVNVNLPNDTAWAATGNNPSITSELVDRSAWIQLDPKVPDPSQRTGFKHERIEKWAKDNRAKLCWAFTTLVQNWIANGQPAFTQQRLGGFESWSQIVGGILDVAGIEGFLQNHKRLKARSDGESNEWKQFVSAWWSEFSTRPVGVAEVFNLCEVNDLLDQVRGSGTDRSQRIRLGRALPTQLERVFDIGTQNEPLMLRIERLGINNYTKSRLYKLMTAKNGFKQT